MEREIKFRGKRLDNQQWVYGGVSIFQGEATIFDSNDMTNSAYEVDINTVGQFVRLDSNKNELYENDIVMDIIYVKFTIQFNDELSSFCLYPIDSSNRFTSIYPELIITKCD